MIDTIITGLLQSAPLALATLAIALIFKTSITTNFAQGMIGSLASYIVTYLLMPVPDVNGVLPNPSFWEYFIAIIAGVTFGFIFSALIDIIIFRNSRFANPITKQIVTMGVVLIILGLIPLMFGINSRSLPRLGSNLSGSWIDQIIDQVLALLALAGSVQQRHVIISVFLCSVIIITIFVVLRFTKWGLGVRATASNEVVAGMLGVNTHVITAVSWALAGAMGTVAAILISSSRGTFGNVTAYFMITIQVQAFFSAILGGFSTFYGPVLGAIIFSVLNNFFAVVVNPWGTTVLYATILLIVLIKPFGLFGKKAVKKV